MDALLDRALSLDEDALATFLDGLDDAQRDALVELLEKSRSGALERLGETARHRILGAAEDTVADDKTAGNWQLMREIGSGGTGQVFYAERRAHAGDSAAEDTEGFVQRAAVKILWSHRVSTQFRDRFLRERRILASISHPGLAKFLDGGLLGDGRPWFAMEYVEGSDIVTFSRDLPIARRLELFLAVADTIDYAHARLIVHRDIKPQNVFVDCLGQPRVLDFGIARVLGEFESNELTRLHGAALTLQYASPEQVTGRSVDVASDVYQLGLLLYEMLTARRPYEIDESSLQQAIDEICGSSPPPPSAYGTFGRDLDAIVGQALRKEPQHRYGSATAMADDVRRYIDGRPVSARPKSTWYITSRFLRRHALPVAIIAASVVALTVATVFSVRMALEARAEAERSRTTQEILASVFQQADPFGEGGADISLADALIRAKPSIEAQIAWDPRLAWEVNKTLAEIFSSLALFDHEREAYEAAWDAAKEMGGDNEGPVLYAIAGIGNILARTDPAKSVRFFSEHLPASPSSESAAVDWLSAKYAEISAWTRLRDDDRADEGAREMARVAEAFGVDAPRTLGRINQLLAGAARRADNIDAADAHWASAVAYMSLADEPLGHAVTLSNMALHYGMTDRFETSGDAFREAIAVFREHAPDDPSYADVLRLYAGLLFRMRQTEEALATLDESLSILDPDAQSYPYYIAQVNRANFAFAVNDTRLAFESIDQGLEVAIGAFGPDSDVTRRILAVFARLLMFARQETDAARLVGLEGAEMCATAAGRMAAIDKAARVIADAPAVEAARQSLWAAIRDAERKLHDGALDDHDFGRALATYRDEQNVFLDPLDRWRMLNALIDIARSAALDLPPDLQAEHARLESLSLETARWMSERHSERIAALLMVLRPGPEPVCMDKQSAAVVP